MLGSLQGDHKSGKMLKNDKTVIYDLVTTAGPAGLTLSPVHITITTILIRGISEAFYGNRYC